MHYFFPKSSISMWNGIIALLMCLGHGQHIYPTDLWDEFSYSQTHHALVAYKFTYIAVNRLHTMPWRTKTIHVTWVATTIISTPLHIMLGPFTAHDLEIA